MPDILKMAREAAKAALEKKAKNVVILKMDDVTIITDYFIIATITNRTQAKAVEDKVEETMEEQGIEILSREGFKDGNWILLDYGSIIVHIFQEEIRSFYDLETLWGDAEVVEIGS